MLPPRRYPASDRTRELRLLGERAGRRCRPRGSCSAGPGATAGSVALAGGAGLAGSLRLLATSDRPAPPIVLFNSRRPVPRERPISGRRFGPKTELRTAPTQPPAGSARSSAAYPRAAGGCAAVTASTRVRFQGAPSGLVEHLRPVADRHEHGDEHTHGEVCRGGGAAAEQHGEQRSRQRDRDDQEPPEPHVEGRAEREHDEEERQRAGERELARVDPAGEIGEHGHHGDGEQDDRTDRPEVGRVLVGGVVEPPKRPLSELYEPPGPFTGAPRRRVTNAKTAPPTITRAHARNGSATLVASSAASPRPGAPAPRASPDARPQPRARRPSTTRSEAARASTDPSACRASRTASRTTRDRKATPCTRPGRRRGRARGRCAPVEHVAPAADRQQPHPHARKRQPDRAAASHDGEPGEHRPDDDRGELRPSPGSPPRRRAQPRPGPPDSRKHAAITGNDAATRSFWAVDDSRTNSENVASRNAADAEDARRSPGDESSRRRTGGSRAPPGTAAPRRADPRRARRRGTGSAAPRAAGTRSAGQSARPESSRAPP